MSSPNDATSPSHNLQAILSSALTSYCTQTGRDLQNDPLSTEIRRCNSPDEILTVFKKQADKFDEFRNGNSKLMKYLDPIVDVLQALSANSAISAGVSLVSQTKFSRSQCAYYCLGFPTRTNNLFWYQHPSHCACLSHFY
jgi:fungal STAND N-terminal Goodbye domain